MVARAGLLSYIRPRAMDVFAPTKRSEIMRRVRSTGTQPEVVVRGILRRLGIRYRCCLGNLPGKPDLVVPDGRKAILVHGCFWHGHRCDAGKLPRSNRAYWKKKQANNALRDSRNARELRSRGWKLLVLWECEIHGNNRLHARISRFLTEKS